MLRTGKDLGRYVLALLLVLLLGASLTTAATGSSGKGQIGGSPTIKLGPPVEGDQTTPALVIGRGRTAGGAAEIVAYGWEGAGNSLSADFCVFIEQLPDEIQFGTCGPAPTRAGSIGMEMKLQRFGPGPARATYIGGLVSPEVASVRLSFHRPGSNRLFHVKPLLGRVRGDLQQRLDQPVPFGFYYAQVNGLVKFSQVRVEALDARGTRVGRIGRERI